MTSFKPIIRRLKVEDASSLMLFLRDPNFCCINDVDFWRDEEIVAWLHDSLDYCICVSTEEKIVGFLLLHYHAATNKVHLENLFVMKEYRRMGLGSKMVAEAIEHYRKNDALTRFVALVSKENFDCQSALMKSGFENGNTMKWMQKNV